MCCATRCLALCVVRGPGPGLAARVLAVGQGRRPAPQTTTDEGGGGKGQRRTVAGRENEVAHTGGLQGMLVPLLWSGAGRAGRAGTATQDAPGRSKLGLTLNAWQPVTPGCRGAWPGAEGMRTAFAVCSASAAGPEPGMRGGAGPDRGRSTAWRSSVGREDERLRGGRGEERRSRDGKVREGARWRGASAMR